MTMIQAEVNDLSVAQALTAIAPFLIGEPRLFESKPISKVNEEEKAFEAKAQEIAATVKPTSKRPTRKEALQVVLIGHNTFWNQQGVPDPTLRNAVGALSKALRPFSIFGSPLDLLCTREKEFFTDAPCKGAYKGTRYIPTKLGKRVREILKEQGHI